MGPGSEEEEEESHESHPGYQIDTADRRYVF